MVRSLQARQLILLLLLVAAAVAAGVLMFGLFRQSASARVGQADAEIGRACDAIGEAYRFYSSGWYGRDSAIQDDSFRSGLTTVLQSALRRREGVEGGIWHRGNGSLAYAYPTYEGGPKTDLPQAELSRIREINGLAVTEDHPVSNRYPTPSQTLVISACPLPGPIPELSAWTMTRVTTFAGRAYEQLMAGLAILLATALAAAAVLIQLTLSWSRHVSRIQAALAAHDLAELPPIPATGERELDQIVTALNDAGRRLGESRLRAQELAHQVATAERLAAIGRIAAGVAHEIRNPIAGMRLKAENALAAGGERYPDALTVILSQIERLDRLLSRLLNVTQPERTHVEKVDVAAFLERCRGSVRELAQARGLRLEFRTAVETALVDPELLLRALDNLLLNAIQAAPQGSCIRLEAAKRNDQLVFSVHDEGTGPPSSVRAHLFEPFVTGRPDGTGLGLSIVREVAEAHGGTARFEDHAPGTAFEIILPCQLS